MAPEKTQCDLIIDRLWDQFYADLYGPSWREDQKKLQGSVEISRERGFKIGARQMYLELTTEGGLYGHEQQEKGRDKEGVEDGSEEKAHD